MDISIISPSVRAGGLEVVSKALKQQSFRNFEWLIGSPFNPKKKEARWVKDDFKGGFWSLNRIYNKMIKQAQGKLLISWQDYTFAKPDCLEMFWSHYKNNPKVLVSAVGNKYTDKTWTCQTWKDPRERDDLGSFYEVFPSDVEWNLCSCEKKALYKIGGFCELFDLSFFGMDGYGVNERLDKVGYKFYLDQSIKSYSLEHSRLSKDWDKYNGLNGGYATLKKKLMKQGKWFKMDYLS